MIKNFGSKDTEDLFNGLRTKKTMKLLPQQLHAKAVIKLEQIDLSTCIEDLMVPPSNRLEKKEGDLKDFYGIRINDQYRIIFRWDNGDAFEVEITDYH